MVGHLHPCARVRVRGKALRRPCFIGDGSRLMLPAFGAYTGSLNVLHPAFADVFSEPAIWAVGREKVVRLHPAQLIPD
jgi:hypothetical protein